jgi:hypothetical protein
MNPFRWIWERLTAIKYREMEQSPMTLERRRRASLTQAREDDRLSKLARDTSARDPEALARRLRIG